MLTGPDRSSGIFTVIVLMLVDRVDGKVVLTNVPPRRIDAFAGETVKFNWNYTVDNKNLDFGYYASSPVWYYYNADGTNSAISVDDGLNNWKWTISRRHCPPRLLYPTVRVSKESVATLVISNVTKEDSGWYEIYLALRIHQPITNKVKLVVTDKTARFTKVPPSTLFVAKGKAARFEWDYTYDNRKVEFHPESPVWAFINQNNQWVTIATGKKDRLFSAVINTTTCPARLLNPIRGRVVQPATLVISNVTQSDNGIYGCRLRLQRDFPINSTSTLVVTDCPKLFLSTLRTKIVQEGSDVTIRCMANGSPVPDVTWVKIALQKVLVISKNKGGGFLRFKEIKRNEGGIYECQANNNPNEPPVTTRINIVVMYLKISLIPLEKSGEAEIVEGEDLNITCALNPMWQANITWIGMPLHDTFKMENVEVNSGTLAIRNISRSQQGRYQCQAYDKRDDILGLANVFIKIMYKPEIDQVLSTEHNISWFADTIYLRCVARGVPVPKVTWYGLNGRILVNGTSYVPGRRTLKLIRVNSLDFGKYSCLANNKYGIAWHNITVTQYCPCKQTQKKKKEKKNEKKNNRSTNSFDKNIQRIKGSKNASNAVEISCNDDGTGATGQLVLGNINFSEPPTLTQSESALNANATVREHYEELTSNPAKISSLRNYEHLDPTNRESTRQKGFQTFGNHQQSSYEQLQLAPSFPVYQKLHKSNDMENCV